MLSPQKAIIATRFVVVGPFYRCIIPGDFVVAAKFTQNNVRAVYIIVVAQQSNSPAEFKEASPVYKENVIKVYSHVGFGSTSFR